MSVENSIVFTVVKKIENRYKQVMMG